MSVVFSPEALGDLGEIRTFVIVYRIEGERVEIVRIWHGARDR